MEAVEQSEKQNTDKECHFIKLLYCGGYVSKTLAICSQLV